MNDFGDMFSFGATKQLIESNKFNRRGGITEKMDFKS